MASRKQVGLVVAMLAEAFGRKTTPALFEAYQIALGDVSDHAVGTAGKAALCGTGGFMPTPGQLRELALTDGRGMGSRVDEAWETLNKAIDRFGSTKSVNFRDGLINATVRTLGGWEYICQRPVEEFAKWVKRDFTATYTRLMQSGCSLDSTRYLPGAVERENAAWVGKPYGNGEKLYQHPAPEEVAAPYTPLLEAPPATQQLTQRPAELPKLEIKKATA